MTAKNKKWAKARKVTSFRFPFELANLLEQSAEYNFRSVNADIVVRLRQSFEAEGRFKFAPTSEEDAA